MAATILIHEMSDATTGVDKTSGTVRFKSADENTVDSNNRLTVPGAGTIYSFTKQLRLRMTVAPDVDVSNPRAYSDGANGFGTGIGVQYDNQGVTFATQVNTDIAGADFFTATSGSPIDMDTVDTGPFTVSDLNTHIGDILRLQMSVASTASNGQLTPETLTFAYDET